MSSFKSFLSPSRQNPIQQKGFFVSLAIAALVLLLHFPFDGYDYEHYVITRYSIGPCNRPPDVSVGQIKEMSYEELRQRQEAIKGCFNEGEFQTLPFFDWKSKAPIIAWFGSVVHVIAAFVFSLSLAGIWLWVFRDIRQRATDRN
jgi:hypothetical protein